VPGCFDASIKPEEKKVIPSRITDVFFGDDINLKNNFDLHNFFNLHLTVH
jgi:hypothetical protein